MIDLDKNDKEILSPCNEKSALVVVEAVMKKNE